MIERTEQQQLAFEKFEKLKIGALFMSMGTGKTRVALDLISSKSSKIDNVIYICPFSIKHEIELEKNIWHPEISLQLIGAETLSKSARVFLKLLNTVNERTFLVVDESLKIKNPNSIRTERILKLGRKAGYRLIMNGTPLSKNVLDLWAQMEFLSPKVLNMNYQQFKYSFCEFYTDGQLKGLVKKQHNLDYLSSLIAPYVYECDLQIDVRKIPIYTSYNMTDAEHYIYEAIKQKYLEDYDNTGYFNFQSMSVDLQHHYISSEGAKKELADHLELFKDEQVLIYVKYLDSIPDGAAQYVGSMSEKEKAATYDAFKKGEIKHLFITYGCGSYGLNFQNCNNMIIFGMTFDYSELIQAEARIYRMGQIEDANYYFIVCNCGLDDMILRSIKKKSNLLDCIKKEIAKKGNKEWLKNL